MCYLEMIFYSEECLSAQNLLSYHDSPCHFYFHFYFFLSAYLHYQSKSGSSTVTMTVTWYCRLRARRALKLFNDVSLRTRRVLSSQALYSDNALLVLIGDSINALLALNWRHRRLWRKKTWRREEKMKGRTNGRRRRRRKRGKEEKMNKKNKIKVEREEDRKRRSNIPGIHFIVWNNILYQTRTWLYDKKLQCECHNIQICQ